MAEHAPSKVLVKYLTDVDAVQNTNSLTDWYATFGTGGDTPDNAVTVADTAPVMDGREMGGRYVKHPGVQVRVRTKAYADGWAKAKEIEDRLSEIQNAVVNMGGGDQYRIVSFSLTSGPLFIGQEEKNRRQHFTLNGTMTIQRA
jgi:hypothetical protein